MTLVPGLLRAVRHSCARQIQRPQVVRAFSTNPPSDTSDSQTTNTFESADDFQRRIFGDIPGGNSRSYKFFQQLDKTEKAHDRSGFGSKLNFTKGSDGLDGVDESFNRINILSDRMNAKLKEAATYFEYDAAEVDSDSYSYRPDMPFRTDTTYETKDLDLTKPGTRKPPRRLEFETTTDEVLRKADFRNVRFLANFITEAGVIIKRSKTKISAKAQRKVAREIKTARAFGLMPFTTMGTKQFIFGNTMENRDKDYEFETNDYNFVDDSKAPLDS